jgi:hypothetical protein
VYWVRVAEDLPDGTILIENMHDTGKITVPHVRARVERDLIYPLLRGRDIQRWNARPNDCVIIVQDPRTRKGIPEAKMRVDKPLTYAYLKRFEAERRGRSGFRKYFRPDDPFYSMYNVGPQTFSPVKVVWPGEVAATLRCAVVSGSALCVPDQTAYYVPAPELLEAHLLAAVLNSCPARAYYRSRAYKHTSMSFVADLAIPRFDPTQALHRRLSDLSHAAHEAAARADDKRVAEIEAEVDEAAAELWGLTPKELAIIQKALRER